MNTFVREALDHYMRDADTRLQQKVTEARLLLAKNHAHSIEVACTAANSSYAIIDFTRRGYDPKLDKLNVCIWFDDTAKEVCDRIRQMVQLDEGRRLAVQQAAARKGM